MVVFLLTTNGGDAMASYVQTALINNESVFYQGKVSLWSLTPYFVIGLFTLPLFGLGLLFWLVAAIRYFTTELAITDKRIISKFGLIRRDTVEVNINKVESMQVDQSITGRIFNFGTITIAGAGDPKAPIPGISSPLVFRKKFFEVQEETGAVL